MAAAAISDFRNFKFLTVATVKRVKTASLCRMSSKSLEPRPRYVSFNIMLVWLESAYSRPFLGHISPNHVTHHPNPKMDHPWAKPRHLSHKQWKSVARFWTFKREKRQDRRGQDRKKSQKGLYFTYLWRSPTKAMYMKICEVGGVLDVITCAKFQNEIFRGYDFTGGRIFHFSYRFRMGLTTVQRNCAACDWTFFRQLLRLRRYERILVEIVVLEKGWSLWTQISEEMVGSPTDNCWCQKTWVPGL